MIYDPPIDNSPEECGIRIGSHAGNGGIFYHAGKFWYRSWRLGWTPCTKLVIHDGEFAIMYDGVVKIRIWLTITPEYRGTFDMDQKSHRMLFESLLVL